MRSRSVARFGSIAVVIAACGGGGGDEAGFVTAQLGEAPAAVLEQDGARSILVTMIDFGAAAELRGLDPPSAERAGTGELGHWMVELTGRLDTADRLGFVAPSVLNEPSAVMGRPRRS